MTLEYAPRGLFGVLTPQANTTVEPELAVMTPTGYAWINGRLVSGQPTIEARLVDYYDRLEGALDQFANAPVKAVAIACTGASYLCGAEREDAFVAAWSARLGAPVVTAAKSVVAVLTALDARRIGLASPYPDSLNRASEAYWTSRGFTVAARASAFAESRTETFHPIYSLSARSARAAVDRLKSAEVDAIVMLGTGMPTLGPILAANAAGGPPVLSCMLAMGCCTVATVAGEALSPGLVAGWTDGIVWGGRDRLPVDA